MSNKNVMLGVAGGVAIAAGIIAWLYSGSADPITIKGNNGVTVQARTSMKDTVITRDKDGEKLWEFHVDVVEKDKVVSNSNEEDNNSNEVKENTLNPVNVPIEIQLNY